MLDFAARPGGSGGGRRNDTVPNSLGSLFAEQKRKTGVVAPKRFIQKIKHDREQYRPYNEHQARTQLRAGPRPTTRSHCCYHKYHLHAGRRRSICCRSAGNAKICRAVVRVATMSNSLHWQY